MDKVSTIIELRKFCESIGCSGMSKDCIDKPQYCQIIRKVIWEKMKEGE